MQQQQPVLTLLRRRRLLLLTLPSGRVLLACCSRSVQCCVASRCGLGGFRFATVNRLCLFFVLLAAANAAPDEPATELEPKPLCLRCRAC